MHIWETKLNLVCVALKGWAKDYYKEPEIVKQDMKRMLEEVQKDIDGQGVTKEKQ